MRNYLKLLNFELARFMKIYLVLIGLTTAIQLVGVVIEARHFLERSNEIMADEGLTRVEYIFNYGQVNLLYVVDNIYFLGTIVFSAAALIFYCFFIWYREWFGKNTFVYRLLMLPTERLNIFLAKGSAIFLFVLGLIALEVLLLSASSKLLEWSIPSDMIMEMGVLEAINGSEFLRVILPVSFPQFLLHYGIGMMAVAVVFTAILLERCFRLKGAILGILYAAVMTVILLLPVILSEFSARMVLYPSELIMLLMGLAAAITAASIWLGNYLLNRKITI